MELTKDSQYVLYEHSKRVPRKRDHNINERPFYMLAHAVSWKQH